MAIENEDPTNRVTYKKEDEHTQILISRNLKLCQQTMTPSITEAKKVAVRAHERIDENEKEYESRLTRLDDKEVGKVTIMWKERNKIIGVGAVLLLAILANIFIGVNSGARIDKAMLKEAVKAALTELKP